MEMVANALAVGLNEFDIEAPLISRTCLNRVSREINLFLYYYYFIVFITD